MWRVKIEWDAIVAAKCRFLIAFSQGQGQQFQLKSLKADSRLTSLLPGILSFAAVLNDTMSYILKLHMKKKQRDFFLFLLFIYFFFVGLSAYKMHMPIGLSFSSVCIF